MKTGKTILTLFIIHYSSFIVNCYAQQWRVFTTANSPLPDNGAGHIVIGSNNVKWISTLRGLVRIENNNWQIFNRLNSPLTTDTVIVEAVDNMNNIWIRLYQKGLVKYSGFDWVFYNSTNSGLPSNNTVTLSIGQNNIKWVGTPGLIKFDDINWTIYNSTNSGLPNNVVKTVAFEGNTKWIGTFSVSGGMAKFNDTNWVVYNTGNSGLLSNAIEDIEIDIAGIKWICTYGGGLARFNSVLNSWVVYLPSNSGIPSAYPRCITFKNNYTKYIGTDGGMAIFNDTAWQVFNISNSPLLTNEIIDIEIDEHGNAWIGTMNGLYIYNSNQIIGVSTLTNYIPKSFELHQNYPNPFNPTTTIEFSVKQRESITLKIYNLLGEEVSQLINSELSAGDYKIDFNGGILPSGIYYYTLITPTVTIARKMVLAK